MFSKRPQTQEAPLALEEVQTPGIKTIGGLADFLSVPTSKTLKAVFYVADGDVVFVTVRGDLEVNELKLRNVLRANELRLAGPEEVREAGLVAGSASPVGLTDMKIVADDSIRLGSNFVVGANKLDYHLRNANYPRDFQADLIADIAMAEAGHACPNCGSPLVERRGIEVGHVFKLGTRYSDAFGAHFPDQDGNQRPIVMGCYGIGVGRLLAAAIEQHHDEKGIVFPPPIAPYHVCLVALNTENPQVADMAEAICRELEDAGIHVLYDDRTESAGVKFNDADLLGLPVRLVVSVRNLRRDVVEVKRRADSQASTVPRDQVVKKVEELLSS